ncbi:WD repeat domain-containing protein 83 [Diorhabda sublineata]|uniref:WD repeat domain-containing protein 83 n=1 Tax=Diorhabda sublineata TaxID=1163346 RepID=UPI0024E1480E|nr:WD repeat domain-containing protein 83 [Diorhabda sublineata]
MDLINSNTIDCNQGAVRAVRFNVDGSYCLTCGSDKKLKLWNPYKGILLKTYGGHGNEVLDVCGSCDNSQLVSCSSDKSCILWDVTTGQPTRRLRGHAATVTCVKYNEESTIVVSGSLDNTLMCWDVKSRSQNPVQTMKDAKDCVTSLQVTDHEILVGSVDCSFRRYDLRNARCDSDFVGAPVVSVCFSHDGQCVLAGSADNTIRLFDKTSGEMLGQYTGHRTDDMNIESAIITNDNYVLSGSKTGELWCWDLVSTEVVKKFVHTAGKVLNSLSVHPKKDTVLTAAVRSIKLWEKPEQVLVNENE